LIALYFDESFFDWRIVRGARSLGIDVLTVLEAELLGASDADQLEFARAADRAIVTADEADFPRLSADLLRRGEHHGGIVIARRRGVEIGPTITALARIAELPRGALNDRVEYLSRWTHEANR
jgi:hypothetical protein